MTVRNMRSLLVEKYQYITPDGLVYELHDPPDRAVMYFSGDGMPDANYDVRSGPFQHGQSVNSYRLTPTNVDIVIYHRGCSREDYLTNRIGLNNYLRHSRTGDNNPIPGQIRRIYADGTVRDLDVFLSKPPLYAPSSEGWNSFAINETLQFIAYNPVMYDPTTVVVSDHDYTTIPPTYTTLRFPTTFPISFTGLRYTFLTKSYVIVYAGTWEEYPKILITGPGKDLSIAHLESGDTIALSNYVLAIGEVITIDLTYGEKTIVNNAGVSLLGYISDTSNLTRFRLLPDPLLAGGINTISVTMSLGDTNTGFEIRYKNRYEGK